MSDSIDDGQDTSGHSPAVRRLPIRTLEDLLHLIGKGPFEVAQLGPGPLYGPVVAARLGPARLTCGTTLTSMRGWGEIPKGFVSAIVVLGLEGEACFDGIPLEPDMLIVQHPGSAFEGGAAGHYSYAALEVPAEAFAEHAESVAGGEPQVFEGRSATAYRLPPEDAARAKCLASELATLAQREADDPASRPLTVDLDRMYEAWMAVVAAATTGETLTDDPPHSGFDRHRAFRRAEEYLRSHLMDPVYMVELCKAAGASERSLQYVFRERVGMSPMAYLRVLRLHRLREDLRRVDGGARGRVVRGAVRWNLGHLGRAASDYRGLFGETPSETLTRAVSSG